MAWFLDTFEKVKGWSEPSAFTGKPVVMGGSLGKVRFYRQGESSFFARRSVLWVFLGKPLRVGIQGYGNVGSRAHRFVEEDLGLKVVAVYCDLGAAIYNPSGLKYSEVSKFKENTLFEGFRGGEEFFP